MKKVATLFLIFLILTSAACGLKPRTPLAAYEFVTKMEAAGFEIKDAADQFEEGEVEAAYLAVGDNYQIEFYVVPSVDQAMAAFGANKARFEAVKDSASSIKSVEGKNFSYYTLTYTDIYYVVSRTDNTFIYVVADAEYKKEISKIISDLGY